MSEMGLEHAPLALDESFAQDHGELPAPVDAVDDVLGDGDPDLKVSLVNATFQLRGFAFQRRQQLLSYPFMIRLN